MDKIKIKEDIYKNKFKMENINKKKIIMCIIIKENVNITKIDFLDYSKKIYKLFLF
jgi:hypothetical protein